jgi:proteasome lid subunit RPN8/RPN11
MANKPTPSKLADSYQTYPTASAAAVAALRGIDVTKFERGGGILFNKDQGVYAATEPVGQNDESHFSAAVAVPKGWTLHSTYHTHPSGENSTMFSGDDISTAQQLKAPSYILARDDNKIRVFDPATSKTFDDDSSGGRFFGWQGIERQHRGRGSADTSANSRAARRPGFAPPAAATPPAGPVTTTSVGGSRITMDRFAAQHRARKYRHKVVHIK